MHKIRINIQIYIYKYIQFFIHKIRGLSVQGIYLIEPNLDLNQLRSFSKATCQKWAKRSSWWFAAKRPRAKRPFSSSLFIIIKIFRRTNNKRSRRRGHKMRQRRTNTFRQSRTSTWPAGKETKVSRKNCASTTRKASKTSRTWTRSIKFERIFRSSTAPYWCFPPRTPTRYSALRSWKAKSKSLKTKRKHAILYWLIIILTPTQPLRCQTGTKCDKSCSRDCAVTSTSSSESINATYCANRSSIWQRILLKLAPKVPWTSFSQSKNPKFSPATNKQTYFFLFFFFVVVNFKISFIYH